MSNGSPASPRPASPAGPPRKDRAFGLDKRFLAPILITCILAVGQLTYGILESYWATGLAILSSIALELVLGRLVTGRWPHLASAYITGISVGIIIRSTQLWPYVLCSVLAISSKYALRVRGRHIWNPSNLGVSVLLFLIPWAVVPLSQQWGNEKWPMLIILCLGSLILYSLRRLHITLTYVAAFTVLAAVRSAYIVWPEVGDNAGPGLAELLYGRWIVEMGLLTAPAYQLFIFFMITDPKTTTRTWSRQCAVAVLVAVVENVLRLTREIHAPYYALFIVAPVTNLMEIWWDSRQAAGSAGADAQAGVQRGPHPAAKELARETAP